MSMAGKSMAGMVGALGQGGPASAGKELAKLFDGKADRPARGGMNDILDSRPVCLQIHVSLEHVILDPIGTSISRPF